MEGSEKIVVDASVAVKWFLEEVHSEKAEALLKDYARGLVDLVSPDLMPYEVLNALRYNLDFGKADLEKVASVIEGYQLLLVPFNAGTTIDMAYDHGITIYDATYVALAKEMGIEFYTADERLLDKLADLKWARHLSEYYRQDPGEEP
ncbi:MAG: type II toxin-antitoxin system VapC family toxin [Euryarchaeota archaeon]|nr:type II toxin-antitoxin system VapC family toxin [Euryarchaeota archaeon]